VGGDPAAEIGIATPESPGPDANENQRALATIELHANDVAPTQRLARTRSLDGASAPECEARSFSEVVGRQDVDRRARTLVSVGDPIGARHRLTEACGDQ
jgi:hypothetical protein